MTEIDKLTERKYEKVIRPTIKSKMEREGWTGAAGRAKLKLLAHFDSVIRETGKYISEVPLFEYVGPPEKKDALFRSGNVPWSVARELAFREIKRLVQGAVDLFVMDVEGAQSGRNKLYMNASPPPRGG